MGWKKPTPALEAGETTPILKFTGSFGVLPLWMTVLYHIHHGGVAGCPPQWR